MVVKMVVNSGRSLVCPARENIIKLVNYDDRVIVAAVVSIEI